jgi:GH35 family endo-1,4-beta-xylanase
MKKWSTVFLLVIILCFNGAAQLSQKTRDSINALTEEDYRLLKNRLGITALRAGADGNNPAAPNAANYDEAKAAFHSSLPDPLLRNNGKKVTKERTWWKKRRPELINDFDSEVYGRTPRNIPAVTWKVVNRWNRMEGDIPVVTKKIIGHIDNSSYPSITVDIDLTLTTPANASGPVPVMMELAFVFPQGMRRPSDTAAVRTPSGQEQVLAKGWGYAVLIPVSVQPDHGAGLTSGIIGLVNRGQRRNPGDWGALKAWAWGASRALDYLETDPAVDARQVGIEGHSRYGKAAAVAMAYDPRFAIGFISSSGEGGLSLYRRHYGELLENVAASGEYHWMAGNFLQYAGPKTVADLPVDAHHLVALIAPRPVFISSGTAGDQWVDPKGMFLAGVHAEPVYRLLGKKGLGETEFPPTGTGLMEGDIAFRQHTGGHTPAPNWPYFLQFASRYIQSKSTVIPKQLEYVKGLKDYFRDYFPIGVAVSPRSLKTDEAGLILQQFNSITPENAMKMGPIHPGAQDYFWKDADSIAAFARRHQLKMRGHTLAWHNQTPEWIFKDAEGKPVPRDVLLQRLRDHIHAVVGRYKDVIYAWDVVNEAISDKRDEYLRPSPWLTIIGEDFISKAFQYAHEADPKALLFYNDYNEIDAVKREKIFRLVKSLKDAGVPIHGLGLQGHWAVNEPSEGQLDSTLGLFAQLGVTLQITELDISVYPKEHNARDRRPEDLNTTFTAEREQKQLEVYRTIFRLFKKYRDVISGVTFWNISDRDSWLDDFPVKGRKDYPLLFDAQLKPKKAFYEVIKLVDK